MLPDRELAGGGCGRCRTAEFPILAGKARGDERAREAADRRLRGRAEGRCSPGSLSRSLLTSAGARSNGRVTVNRDRPATIAYRRADAGTGAESSRSGTGLAATAARAAPQPGPKPGHRRICATRQRMIERSTPNQNPQPHPQRPRPARVPGARVDRRDGRRVRCAHPPSHGRQPAADQTSRHT